MNIFKTLLKQFVLAFSMFIKKQKQKNKFC